MKQVKSIILIVVFLLAWIVSCGIAANQAVQNDWGEAIFKIAYGVSYYAGDKITLWEDGSILLRGDTWSAWGCLPLQYCGGVEFHYQENAEVIGGQ